MAYSSALVKRYVAENGPQWIRSITAPSAQNSIVIAHISFPGRRSLAMHLQLATVTAIGSVET